VSVSVETNLYKLDLFFTLVRLMHFSVKTLKIRENDDGNVCCFLRVMLVCWCAGVLVCWCAYGARSSGCLLAFVCVPNVECVTGRWDGRG
jgi:hypothetical protein